MRRGRPFGARCARGPSPSVPGRAPCRLGARPPGTGVGILSPPHGQRVASGPLSRHRAGVSASVTPRGHPGSGPSLLQESSHAVILWRSRAAESETDSEVREFNPVGRAAPRRQSPQPAAGPQA